MAYMGKPVVIFDILFLRQHSLVMQSLHATEGAEPTNGDGFGVGFYVNSGEEPAFYRTTEPAWHDRNMKDLSQHIKSGCVFAHVRAASHGGAIQQTNCHPFRHGKWLFMHNGVIRGFNLVKRDLMLRIDPEYFSEIEGSTDSEIFFYLALSFGLQDDPLAAMAETVGFIIATGNRWKVENPIQMTVCITNGEELWGFRYSSETKSRTLYYSTDYTHLKQMVAHTPVEKQLEIFNEESRFIVSEPLGDMPGEWNPVPEATYLVVKGQNLKMAPFVPILPSLSVKKSRVA
jgi:predicted glutamine amidotransferase